MRLLVTLIAMLVVVAPSYSASTSTLHKREHRQIHSLHRYVGTVTFFNNHRWLLKHGSIHNRKVAHLELRKAHIWIPILKKELAETRRALNPPERYVANSVASHDAMWECIHNKEGDWATGYNPAGPYYGGLQMTWGWGELDGDPRNYSSTQQKLAAEHEWAKNGYSLSFMRQQWPQTSYGCI
jgi:hypothetical protein